MAKLTAKQESFVERMKTSDELARHGFELLLARKDFDIFFDALIDAGLFAPDKNPKIVPGDEPNTYRVPYWHALDYLEAIAKLADQKHDIALAKKVMEIVRKISTAREPDNTIRDNHHTFRKFADILGCLPTSAVSRADLDLIPVWLSSKFDRGWVAHDLDKGALKRFLESDKPEDWDKACSILRHCTAITWQKDVGFLKDKERPVSVVEDYWLKQLIKNNSATFGVRAGQMAAALLLSHSPKQSNKQ